MKRFGIIIATILVATSAGGQQSVTKSAAGMVEGHKAVSDTQVHPMMIGQLRQKCLAETHNELTIGGECLDRDYTDYESYKPWLDSLGMRFIRLQAGWAKTEKVKGVYDFTWLDRIIDDCVARGIEPWLETSYGNPIYAGGGTPYLAGGWPESKEAVKAWNNWVKAMATRYRGKVHWWEIWNEPELRMQPEPYIGAKPSEYAPRVKGSFESLVDLQTRTAAIIKKVDPDAHIASCGLARLDPDFLDELLTAYEQRHKDKLFEYISYHGYKYRPEDMYSDVERMQAVLASHATHIKLWQGETGAPSKGGMGGALSDYDWSEISQGKWALRRILSDRGRDIRTGLFCISDMGYGKKDLVRRKNHKGLLETDSNNQVVRPKASFDAVRNLVSLYDLLDRVESTDGIVIPHGKKESLSLYAFRDSETGVRSIVFWDDSGTPSDSEFTRTVTAILEAVTSADVRTAAAFKDPVAIDIRTGDVFSIPSRNEEGRQILLEVPAYDSPVLVTERAVVKTVCQRNPASSSSHRR